VLCRAARLPRAAPRRPAAANISGFEILRYDPADVSRRLSYLAKRLPAAVRHGVRAEAGLLMTAAPKPALRYPARLVDRCVCSRARMRVC
jgi:hypothetical protein